jgi:hypothetical protein
VNIRTTFLVLRTPPPPPRLVMPKPAALSVSDESFENVHADQGKSPVAKKES